MRSQPGSSTARIEDRWAEAAAMLRARQQRAGAGAEPEAAPAAPPPAPKRTPKPTAKPTPKPTPKPSAERAAKPAPEKPAAKPATEREAEPDRKVEPGAAHHPKLVFRPPEPTKAEQEGPPLPLWSPEPPKARPPLAERAAHREELQDPLATPPIMMAEWDRFGDEEEAAHRAAQRRKLATRILAGLGAVAVVAGAVWIWTTTRDMPPYEARSTALPRAAIPPAGAAPAPAVGTEPEPEAAAAPAVGTEPEPEAAAATPEPTAAAPPGAGVGETRAPHQRFSWSMAAMGTMAAARSLVEGLRRRAPDQAFAIAPIVSDGRTLYRVLGGLAADREELARIREPLGQATGQPAGTWLVREAPLAFSLRDFGDAESASGWVAELARSGVPAYVLVVDRDDGSTVHRVYAGAYANEAEAAPLRALMDSAGLRGVSLVERRGRVGG
jgi:hypothetical protein